MKKIISLSTILCCSLVMAQLAIGKATVSSPSVSLEFGNVAGQASTQKGLLLPWVTSRNNVSGVVSGTMVFDSSDRKAYVKKDAGWVDLSVDTTGAVDMSLQTGKTDAPNAKVNIGATPESGVPGVLVLSDTNKAMILPLVDKYTSVVSPSPGMMVYDLANNMLCFYNGNVWSFWKP